MKTKAVGYIRVSTENQAEEGLSLDIQREAIMSYCKEQRYELIRIYEDPGVSGATLDRPSLLELLEGAEASEFDIVAVYCLDRLSRAMSVQVFVEEKLNEAKVKLVSVTEPGLGESDPSSTLFRQMKTAFAQYEKELIRLRLTAGRIRKHREGGYAGGSPPLGYVVEKRGREHSKLVIDEEEALLVRYIRKLRRKGLSLREIADKLNEEGYRTKRGGKFYHSSVKLILENPIYRGKIRYAGEVTEGVHEPIIRGRSKV